jgi:multidrug efflux pump subunit AcrB
VTIELIGRDFSRLGQLALQIQDRIRSVPGLVNLNEDYDAGKPELRVIVDRDAAAVKDVTTFDVAQTIRTAVNGTEAGKYRVGEDEHDIIVRLQPESRDSLEALADLSVADSEGRPVPLRDVARLERGVGPATINRKDMKRVVTIEGDVVRAPGRTEDSVRAEVAARLQELDLPPGYRWRFGGSNEEEQASQEFLSKAFVVAVLLIGLVLVTQFNSLILPATIMVSVILSIIGVFWGLIITRTPFGIIMTGIGVISLAGVVVNNAIVLCDFIRQLMARGMPRTEAVIQAGILRLRPVLLTAVTTILGLIPLTFGISFDFSSGKFSVGGESSQWWGPMGVAVIAGLGFATVLTLIVVPVTFHSLDDLSSMLQRVLTGRTVRIGVPARTKGAPAQTDRA